MSSEESRYSYEYAALSGGEIIYPRPVAFQFAPVDAAEMYDFPWLFQDIEKGNFRLNVVPVYVHIREENPFLALAVQKTYKSIQKELHVRALMQNTSFSTFPIDYIIKYDDHGDEYAVISRFLPDFTPFYNLASQYDYASLFNAGLKALKAFHAQGIYHGEPVPENFAMNQHGVVYLHDFASSTMYGKGISVAKRNQDIKTFSKMLGNLYS